MTPYFSIILPVYNVETYLERCIQSVLGQSFRDYELILVDDGSRDASPEICETYASKYEQIRVIHKPNGGLASARNAGLEIASGEYIWWVDSDDYIEPGALEILYESSRGTEPDIVKFDYYRVESESWPVYSIAEPGIYREERIHRELLEKAFFCSGKYVLSACSHIYRKKFLDKWRLQFVSERIVGSEDYLFNLEATYAARSVVVLRRALYYYELRTGSLTQQYKGDLAERYEKLVDELKAWYRKANAPESYLRKINSFYIWHLIHSTCFFYEYTPARNHSLEQGREKIRILLKKKSVRKALKNCDCSGLNWKQRMQVLAMGLEIEPLFFWLYVKKPTRKE